MSGRSPMRPVVRLPQLITLILGVCTSAVVAAQAEPKPQVPNVPSVPSATLQPEAAQAQATAPTQAQTAALTEQEVPAQVAEAQPAHAEQAAGPRVLRNLVVPQFEAPPNSRARAAVLRTLADHTEVEVVAIDDVTFAARRLQADPNTPEGRAKLSRELGIDAWLDGKVTETTAQLTLIAGDGTVLQELSVESDDEKVLDALTGERMWAALGPSLSPQESYRRAVLAEYERGRSKYEARVAESQRQVELAHQARAHRAFVLRGQFSLAQRKQAALLAAQERQAENGKAELAREAEEARQVELARQAEKARQVELVRQQAEARKAELAQRREQAKAAAQAKVDAKAAAAQAKAEEKAEAKAASAQAKADAADAKAKAKSDRALAKRKNRVGSASLTNTGAQRAHARAVSRKKAAAKQMSSEHAAPRRPKARSSAANGGKDSAEGPQFLSKQ